MITKEKLAKLRTRMHNHKINDKDEAIVELTTQELCDLLDHIDMLDRREAASHTEDDRMELFKR